jgi:hypothetical protein
MSSAKRLIFVSTFNRSSSSLPSQTGRRRLVGAAVRGELTRDQRLVDGASLAWLRAAEAAHNSGFTGSVLLIGAENRRRRWRSSAAGAGLEPGWIRTIRRIRRIRPIRR